MEDDDEQEKTEEPSAYRIEEFRSKGMVSSSKEVINVMVLSGIFVVLIFTIEKLFDQVSTFTRWVYTLSYQTAYTDKMIKIIVTHTMETMFYCLLPIFSVCIFVSFFSHIVQFGFIFSPEGLEPKLERINPLAGMKRLLSIKTIYESFKAILKFTIVVAISFFFFKKEFKFLNNQLHQEFETSIFQTRLSGYRLVGMILLALGFMAFIDFFWEKFQYRKKLLQTKQQQKQEAKEREGHPEIRQRIKSLQRELLKKRMMNDVPKADVIITNPTHYSVALKYDADKMMAPIVVAKGKDYLALKIREIAKKNNITLVENKPLAQGLYKNVRIGEVIPKNLYKAVAEILAYVIKLKKKMKL
jgi:flagellar biosynthetic protein FlhB